MRCALWASDSVPVCCGTGRLDPLTCPAPSRCPYCAADAPRHWIGWGTYERYAGDREDPNRKLVVPRYRCKLTRRTFSLLPDGLLPYCGQRTGSVLLWLYALFVQNEALSTLSRRVSVPRGTLRHLKARFLRVVSVLRLPEREGALDAAGFLEVLADNAVATVVALFRAWKEREPKHTIVGIHVR